MCAEFIRGSLQSSGFAWVIAEPTVGGEAENISLLGAVYAAQTPAYKTKAVAIALDSDGVGVWPESAAQPLVYDFVLVLEIATAQTTATCAAW